MGYIAQASPYAIPTLWAIWITLWIATAFNVKRTQWRESRRIAVWNRAPVLLGCVMLAWPRSLPPLFNRQILPPWPEPPFLGTLLVAAGLIFAVWARWHLGGNWSGQ